MMRTALISMVALLAACGDSNETPPGDASESLESRTEERRSTAGTTLTAMSSNGTFEARVTPQVDPIPLNEAFAVTLTLVDPATGEAFTDYDEVTIDARMPAHGHGMFRDPELVRGDDGVLRAEGFEFQMVGHWEIHVDVRRGPRIERAQMSVNLAF